MFASAFKSGGLSKTVSCLLLLTTTTSHLAFAHEPVRMSELTSPELHAARSWVEGRFEALLRRMPAKRLGKLQNRLARASSRLIDQLETISDSEFIHLSRDRSGKTIADFGLQNASMERETGLTGTQIESALTGAARAPQSTDRASALEKARSLLDRLRALQAAPPSDDVDAFNWKELAQVVGALAILFGVVYLAAFLIAILVPVLGAFLGIFLALAVGMGILILVSRIQIPWVKPAPQS